MLSYKCLKKQKVEYGDYSIMPIQEDNIELIRQWRNQQIEVLRQEFNISKDQQEKYFSEKIWPQLDLKDPIDILMGLYFKDSFIGYGGLVHIAWQHKRAEVSFLLETKRMSTFEIYEKDFKSYLELIKLIATDQLSLNRLYTETYSFRERHIDILESSGFSKEGVMKEHIILDGVLIDSVIHGFLSK
jgi:RimJ/RimL family protein N-acetyltransferase|tara:strand:- start:106 stop:666 length:561 start_codon:yes stop_codon:yes gene_type:complete